MQKKNILTVCAVLLSLGVLNAYAESDPEDIIKYRRNVMKTNGANMAAANAILKGKVKEFDARLGDHAKTVQLFTKNIPALFPKGSDFGDTEALDSVWSKRAEFEKKAKDTEQKASAFAKAVASKNQSNMQAKFKALSDSCSACHKDFRKEEKQ